jgi:dihydroorotate dehydrogenase (NAD+) catalytic subunit
VVDLSVNIGKLKLKNPVMAASGTFGIEYGPLTGINKLGAYVAKTITLRPRAGNPPPRVVETASGMLNSIGLENPGADYFIKNKLAELRRLKTALIVSIAGEEYAELKELARKLSRARGIDALELNLSCPNIKHGSRKGLIAQDGRATAEAIEAVKASTRIPVIAKLSPNVTYIEEIAKAAESAGADALSLVNTFFGTAIDIETQKPLLGNITGGLSGPAIKPMALRFVMETYRAVDIPVIGIGGIMDYKNAIEFFLAGATAIQVGTANFVDPDISVDIIGGIKKYMAGKKIPDIKKLIGNIKI